MPDVKDPFDTLLARMPAIAKAVAAFPEAVQPAAFEALMAAANGTPIAAPAPAGGQDPGQPPPQRAPSKKRRSRTQGAEPSNGKPRRAASAPLKEDRDLDLRPKGKDAWEDFAAAKNPTSQHDKHAVAIYYLAHEASFSPVTIQQVYTAWRRAGWPLPADFANSLRVAASTKGLIDTSDGNDLRLRHAGMNRVEHELPIPTKS